MFIPLSIGQWQKWKRMHPVFINLASLLSRLCFDAILFAGRPTIAKLMMPLLKKDVSFENRNVLYTSFQLKINWNWFEKLCVKFSWSHFVFNAIEQVLGKKVKYVILQLFDKKQTSPFRFFISFCVISPLIIIFTYP